MDRLLVVLDVDSTLTRDEGIDLLAAHVSPEVERDVAAITSQAMRGELDFETSLLLRVAALAGAPAAILSHAAAQVTLTDGAHELVDTLHAHGHLVGVVSGGFHEMVDPVVDALGLDFARANRLEVVDLMLTGHLVGPIIDAQAKADALRAWAQEYRVPLERTVAIGDGGNDVVMLKDAGLGIAFMAKPVARAAADVSVDTPNLAEVLSLLGFDRP